MRIHYCIPKDDRELDTEDTDDVDMSQSSLEDTIIAEDRPESVLPVTTGTQPLDVACQQSIPAEEGEFIRYRHVIKSVFLSIRFVIKSKFKRLR